MATLIGSLFGEATGAGMQETLGLNAVSAASALAAAYLGAAVEASTPEVKRLFSDYLNQTLVAQQTLTELVVQKGWSNPYDTPENQLQAAYRQAQEVLGAEREQ